VTKQLVILVPFFVFLILLALNSCHVQGVSVLSRECLTIFGGCLVGLESVLGDWEFSRSLRRPRECLGSD
jgi:hypothetical protein